MSARILLVEDDPALLAMLKAALAYGGFESESVSRGEDAVAALARGGFEAVLLDLGLPDCDGRELLARLRALSDIPVIVVSGRGSEQDKIDALDRGADDFVAKPFLPGELLARIRAALRRAASQRSGSAIAASERDPVRIGALTLDPLDQSASMGGARVSFNSAEYRVLQVLAASPDEIVGRGDLLSKLYGGDAPAETNVIDVYVSRIRSKLRALPEGEDLIATIRGKGWKLRRP